MDRLTEMEAFAMVVDQGGFTDAARKMGISKSAVSKHVSSLETRLGARLLNRTTRSVSLTEPGRRLHSQCAPLLEGISEAEQEVLTHLQREKLKGKCSKIASAVKLRTHQQLPIALTALAGLSEAPFWHVHNARRVSHRRK